MFYWLLFPLLVHLSLEAKPLTLEACFEIALDQNPRQKAAAEGVLALQEEVLASYAPYYPDLLAHGAMRRFRDYIFLPKLNTPFPLTIPHIVGPINDYMFNLSSHYTIYDSGLRRARLMKAFSNRNIAAEQAEQIRQTLLLQVADSFFSYLRAQSLLEVAEENQARAKDHVLIAEMRRRTGSVPPLDVYRTKAALADADLAIFQSKRDLKMAQSALNVSLGLNPECPLELAQDEEIAVNPKSLDICWFLDAAHKYRPEIGAGYEKIQLVEETMAEIKSEYGPTIAANGLYGKHDSHFFPGQVQWAFGLSLDMPLFEGFRTMHSMRRAKHELFQAQADLEDMSLKVRKDVWDAFALLEESFQSIRSSMSSLAYSEQAYRLAEKRYEVGASPLNDLLDAKAVLFQTEAQLVNSRFYASSSYAALLWSSGIIEGLFNQEDLREVGD